MAGTPSRASGSRAGGCPGPGSPPTPGAGSRLRCLIVNGDDLGLTAGINVGIERACRDGILRSASAMGVGAALADAGERVRRMPALGVGLHLTLVGERPACRPEEVPSLVGRDGRLLPDYRAFLLRYLRGGIRADDLRREFRAQAAAVAALGAPLDHLDSHQHLHLLPGLLARAVELAQEHGIRWIRAPRPVRGRRRRLESSTSTSRSRSRSRSRSTSRSRRPEGGALIPEANEVHRSLAERVMFGAASAWARRSLGRGGWPLIDGSLGFDCSGRLSAEYLLRSLAALPPGVTELICHPGAGDPETRARYEQWGYRWEQELQALTSPAVRDALQSAGVRLTSFGGAGS